MFGSFSVVIPAKNEKELPRTIKSLDYFTLYKDFEIIVVGDRESLDTITEFDAKLILEPENSSMVDAMNIGIKYAKNNIIVKLDADISIHSFYLSKLLSCMNRYDLVSCSASTRTKSTLMNFLFTGRDFFQKYAPLGGSTHGNTMIFRKSDLEDCAGFHYDTELHKIYMESRKRILVINKPYAKEFRPDYSIRFVKKRQLESGHKRHQLGISGSRTLFHTVVRVRPFVIAGWLQEYYKK